MPPPTLANIAVRGDTPRVASCAEHGIAAGPDGRCALCRASLRVAASHDSNRWVGWLLGGGVLLCGGLLASRQLFVNGSSDVAAAEPLRAASPAAAQTAVGSAELEQQAAPVSEPPREKDLTLGGTLPAPSAAPVAASSEVVLGEAAPEASASAAPSASAARSAPTAAEIEAALRSVPIVMYSTAWCSVCQHARTFLQSHGFPFREVDIEHNQAARSEVQQRTGATAVPVLEIDGVMGRPGFSEASTARAIAAGAERRLGVTGLEVRPIPR